MMGSLQQFVLLQRAENRRLVKPDDDGSIDVEYRNAHLAGFLHHFLSRSVIARDVDIFELHTLVCQELFHLMAPGACWGGIDFDGHSSAVENGVYYVLRNAMLAIAAVLAKVLLLDIPPLSTVVHQWYRHPSQ